jgi:hypothetical protein
MCQFTDSAAARLLDLKTSGFCNLGVDAAEIHGRRYPVGVPGNPLRPRGSMGLLV